MSVLSYDSSKLVPEADGLTSVFTEHKLKADAPSFQLRDTFDKIPQSLIADEGKARSRLARSLTLQLQLENLYKADPSKKDLAVACKLNSATYGEHLSAFITAKRKCRSAVLGKAGIKHETRMLIESTVFCLNLFPDDKVNEVLDLAKRENVSLFKRWEMPALQPASSSASTSASTSASSGAKKRKYRYRNQQQSKRRQTAQEYRSPASNPKFEAKGKAASSYSGKRGGRNS